MRMGFSRKPKFHPPYVNFRLAFCFRWQPASVAILTTNGFEVRNQEVAGSIPVSSTKNRILNAPFCRDPAASNKLTTDASVLRTERCIARSQQRLFRVTAQKMFGSLSCYLGVSRDQ